MKNVNTLILTDSERYEYYNNIADIVIKTHFKLNNQSVQDDLKQEAFLKLYSINITTSDDVFNLLYTSVLRELKTQVRMIMNVVKNRKVNIDRVSLEFLN